MADYFPSFTMPAAASLFALLVPLIIVYFLKLRRQRVQLPSLALWQQVIQDQRVNAPFQRFKRNLLLLLQIAALCLISLAAMQPFWRGDLENQDFLPILIDCSASMGALDADGKTRLDLAKAEIRTILNGLSSRQSVCLIAVHSGARRLTDFTDSRSLLQEELARLTVTDLPSSVEEGLRMAQALSRTYPIKKVVLFTDGNLPTREHPLEPGRQVAMVDFDLPFKIDYRVIGAATEKPESVLPNIGITALTAQRRSPDEWQVFVQIDAAVNADSSADLEVLKDGQPEAREQIILPKGESQRLEFPVDAKTATKLELRLIPKGKDALAADNTARIDLPQGRPSLIYCPLAMTTVRHALEGIPGVLVVPQESGAVPTTEFDAVISNDLADLSRDASVFLITGQVPEALKSHLEIIEEPAEVVDWRRETPLLQHVQLKQIQFLDQPQRKPDVKDTDLEKLGYEILAHGPHGPLALRKSEGRRSVYYLLFTPDRSTMPYRVAFPVMLQNLVNIALSQSSAAEVRGLATGILPPLSVAPEEKYTIHGPGGTLPGEYQSDVHGELSGIMAAQVGQYDLSSKSTNKSLAVGMLNATETRLSSVGQLEFRESTVQAAGTVRTDQALWRNIAFVAFVIVLAEWWFYQRRPGPILERETNN